MSQLANIIYDRIIDYIEVRADDNDLRLEYARVMSAQNWNNPEMATLVDVVSAVIEEPLSRSRSDREDDSIIRDAVVRLVDMHTGYFGMSDRRIYDAVPDNVYTTMKQNAYEWEGLLADLSGATRGAGRSRGPARRGASVFDDRQDRGFGRGRSSIFDDEPRGSQRAGNSVFRQAPSPTRSESVFDDLPSAAPPRRTSTGSGWQGNPNRRREEQTTRYQPDSAPTERVAVHEGPDFTKERPYDDFWAKGEHWQVAHLSDFVWNWSPQQPVRRYYDIDQEVCYLVKGTNGQVREEFIPMTDDLTLYAHEIRVSNRPNAHRRGGELAEADPIFLGEDIDITPEERAAQERMRAAVAKHVLEELDVRSLVVKRDPVNTSSLNEAVMVTACDVAKDEEIQKAHMYVRPQFISEVLPGDENTQKALEAIRAVCDADDVDLVKLQTRLKSLRGHMAPNVLNYIDQHFAKEINDTIRDQFGHYGASIDSFIDDFQDMLNSKRFQKHGAGYIAQFISRTRRLTLSLQCLVGEIRNDFLDATDMFPDVENEIETYTNFRNDAAVFWKPVNMVYVAMDSDQLDSVGKEVRFPNRDSGPLTTLLNTAYQKAMETGGTGRVYMLTADHVLYELVPHAGARDVIGIKLA